MDEAEKHQTLDFCREALKSAIQEGYQEHWLISDLPLFIAGQENENFAWQGEGVRIGANFCPDGETFETNFLYMSFDHGVVFPPPNDTHQVWNRLWNVWESRKHGPKDFQDMADRIASLSKKYGKEEPDAFLVFDNLAIGVGRKIVYLGDGSQSSSITKEMLQAMETMEENPMFAPLVLPAQIPLPARYSPAVIAAVVS